VNKKKRSELKQQIGSRRKQLDREEIMHKSQLITRRLWDLRPLQTAEAIMVYAAKDQEVDLSLFIEQSLQADKKVFLPRVEGKDIAVLPFAGWEQMQLSSWGIKEPLGNSVSPDILDAVIVPGLVFDGRGYRLGYGKGYYDRFLSGLSRDVFICGVCYEFQIVDTIYPHAGDIPVHWIVTEQSELAINLDFF
jgi:5-formyltetrahydrofolate cyclo-ligase